MHRYYDSGRDKSIAYFSAIIALILAFMLLVFDIFVFFDLMDYLPGGNGTPRYIEYLVGVIVTLPIVWVLYRFFKKEDVLKIEMSDRERRIGFIWIIFYFVFTFVLIMYLAVTKITIYDFI
jgi:membrane protease YdiL (CAAX protease family)